MRRDLTVLAFVASVSIAWDGCAAEVTLPWIVVSASQDGKVVTMEPHQVDLSYPPPGQRAPMLNVGERNAGIALSEQEFHERQAKPHLIFYFPTMQQIDDVGDAPAGPAARASSSPSAPRSQPSSKSVVGSTGGHRH